METLTAQADHGRSARDPWRRRGLQAARVLALLALLYGLLLGALWWGQERVIFRPVQLAADHAFRVPADVHETWVEVDGGRLNALHLKLPNPAGIVFYLHGNGGSLEHWWVNPVQWRERNLDLFMIDYRGYGKSPGRITSEAQLMADVRAAWLQLRAHYAGKKTIFFGRSLGSGLAAQLAAGLPRAEQPDLVVMVAPYESMLRMKREHYAIVPDALLRYPLRSDLALPKVASALLLIHGEEDRLIHIAHSESLATIAKSAGTSRQVSLLRVPGAGHNDVHRNDTYRQGLAAVLDDVTRR